MANKIKLPEPTGPVTPMRTANPAGGMNDANDERATRHGREVHVGYPVGRYLQAPPYFFTRDKHPAPFVDMYRGHAAFLIASGPSFLSVDRSKLAEPGVLTIGLNNSVKTFRPKLWTCVDDPANFIISTWLDPTIQKFVPISHIDKTLFDSNRWKMTDVKVGDCPNVWFYKRNERFNADQYLWEDTVNWGNHSDLGGGRSVLLASLRILFLLGVRKVFLLGVDMEMNAEKKYHFEQDRSSGSIRGNNSTYRLLQERFTALRPKFEDAGYHVYNCNPASKLTAFDHVPFEEAIRQARHPLFPDDVAAERTEGLYDRKDKERRGIAAAVPAVDKGLLGGVTERVPDRLTAPKPPGCTNCGRQLEEIRRQVGIARDALNRAKADTKAMRDREAKADPTFDPIRLQELVRVEDEKRKAFRRLLAIRDALTGGK